MMSPPLLGLNKASDNLLAKGSVASIALNLTAGLPHPACLPVRHSNSSWFFAELEGPLDERRNKAHGEQSVGLNGLSNRSPAP